MSVAQPPTGCETGQDGDKDLGEKGIELGG